MAISKTPPPGHKPTDAATSGKIEKKSTKSKEKSRTRQTIQRNGDMLATAAMPAAPQSPTNAGPALAAPGVSGHVNIVANGRALANRAFAQYERARSENPDRSLVMESTMNVFAHSLDPA